MDVDSEGTLFARPMSAFEVVDTLSRSTCRISPSSRVVVLSGETVAAAEEDIVVCSLGFRGSSCENEMGMI